MSSWTSRIPEVTRDLKLRAGTASRHAADRVVKGAAARSRVDTGRMRAGWQSERTGEYEYEVSNDVDYTIYNEFGTRNMSAQPMLGPAIEEEYHRQEMADEIQKAFGR